MANTMNAYVSKFVPNDLKWYERDGLMMWYDQRSFKVLSGS